MIEANELMRNTFVAPSSDERADDEEATRAEPSAFETSPLRIRIEMYKLFRKWVER